MLGLLIWLVGFAVFMYLGAPILIRFSQKMSAHPEFQPVDLATLPPPAAQYLGACQQALEVEGFEIVAHLTWNNSAPNVFPILTLYMNRAVGVKAIAAAFYVVSASGAKMTTRYVEFITRYNDGCILQTSSAVSTGTFLHGRKQKTLRLPEVENPHELYGIHRRRMAQLLGSAIEDLPAPGSELLVQQQRIVEDFEEQVGFGRLYLDNSLGVYRPTWKGAYLMTWSLLQPMKAVRQSQNRREAQNALKMLGELPAVRQV